MKQYTKNHFWVEMEGNWAVIGISEFAVRALNGIAYLDLPIVGTPVTAGQPIGSLESSKLAVEIIAPVSGIVSEVNPLAETSLKTINSDPEDAGWFCKIQLLPEKTVPLISEVEYHEFTTKNN